MKFHSNNETRTEKLYLVIHQNKTFVAIALAHNHPHHRVPIEKLRFEPFLVVICLRLHARVCVYACVLWVRVGACVCVCIVGGLFTCTA